MRRLVALTIAGMLLSGCTSNPDAPVNQTPPIRQMDLFFNSLSAQPQPPPSRDYTHVPGYAPAYPPFNEDLGP
jgi:hypothetical protein